MQGKSPPVQVKHVGFHLGTYEKPILCILIYIVIHIVSVSLSITAPVCDSDCAVFDIN